MQSVGIGIGISQFCLYSGNTEMSYCFIFFSLGMMAAFIGDTIGGFFFLSTISLVLLVCVIKITKLIPQEIISGEG